jgi:hypothetical protein
VDRVGKYWVSTSVRLELIRPIECFEELGVSFKEVACGGELKQHCWLPDQSLIKGFEGGRANIKPRVFRFNFFISCIHTFYK